MCLRLGLRFVLHPWKCLSSFFHFIIRLRGCCCLVAKSCPTLCDPMNCRSLPCLLLSLRVCSNSCPLSWWCHPTISSSVTPFSSRLESFPASGSFLMSWLFASGSQSIGVLASASLLPMNIQDWFIDITNKIHLQQWAFILSVSLTWPVVPDCSLSSWDTGNSKTLFILH